MATDEATMTDRPPPDDGAEDACASAERRCARVLEKIATCDAKLNAFSGVLADSARREARTLDRQRRPHPPLEGAAVAVKDNIDTVPAVCSAGLDLYRDYRPARDANVVTLLRRSGALVVGTTRTDAGAFGVIAPDVLNPGFPDCIAGGSSGGVGRRRRCRALCDAAIGTDTGGSVRIPAACCGVFGFKPTLASVSLDGVRPLAKSCDHVGPLARSVGALVSVMSVISPSFRFRPAEWRKTVTVGIPRREIREAAPDVLHGLDDFESASPRTLTFRTVTFPSFDSFSEAHLALTLREAADLYRDVPEGDLSLLPAIARDGIERGRGVSDRQRARLATLRDDLVARVNRLFDEVDYLLLPTLPVAPPPRGSRHVRLGSTDTDILNALIRYTAPFNQTGHPALAFPWHTGDLDVPVSLQLVGSLDADRRLLSLSNEIVPAARRKRGGRPQA